ncbi:MAG: DUF1127 domain-containing protein [Pseudomonadota bacterium]
MLTQTSSAVSTTLVAKGLAKLWQTLAGLARWHAARRDYHRLTRMEDRMLRDIGVTRSDVEHLLSCPPWADDL